MESYIEFLNSTVPHTSGANVQGLMLSMIVFSIMIIYLWDMFRRK